MSTLVIDHEVFVLNASFSEEAMVVSLDDGRIISVPLAWYPRLLHGRREEHLNYELIGNGEGIHWPDLDEDISVEGLVAGRRSGECAASLEAWLVRRRATP